MVGYMRSGFLSLSLSFLISVMGQLKTIRDDSCKAPSHVSSPEVGLGEGGGDNNKSWHLNCAECFARIITF